MSRERLPTTLVLLLLTAPAAAQQGAGGIVDVLGGHGLGGQPTAGDLVGAPGTAPKPAAFEPGWATGAPTLRRGSKGGDVGILQALLGDALAKQGQARPGIDNDFGPNTERAVKRFQGLVGLPETGVADTATWNALRRALHDHPLGTIELFGGEAVGPRYKRNDEAGSDIAPRLIRKAGAPTAMVYESKMAIDADGAGNAWKSDPWGQPTTSLLYPDGTSLDPTKLNYMVLPGGLAQRVPGLRLGDVVAVTYRGQTAYAIYGDVGPRAKIGEGSIRLAKSLGIHADPVKGGTPGGVFYTVFPGSGTGRPLTQAEIDARGAQLLRDAGGRP